MSTADDEKQIALEIKLMFLEDTLEALNEAVLAQGRELEGLARGVDELLGRVADLAQEPGGKRALEDDKPPHY